MVINHANSEALIPSPVLFFNVSDSDLLSLRPRILLVLGIYIDGCLFIGIHKNPISCLIRL